MQTFSQRHGHKPVRTELQFESMDDKLRNSLWNCVYRHYLTDLSPKLINMTLYPCSNAKMLLKMREYLFKLPIDGMELLADMLKGDLKERISKSNWCDVYDIVEYILNYDTFIGGTYDFTRTSTKRPVIKKESDFVVAVRYILKREASAYTVIKSGDEYQIAPVTNESEVEAIESAIQDSSDLGLKNVSTHLQTALSHLSDRTNPDYRNSIKESISAVEAIAQKISGKPNGTLGECLKVINDKLPIHGALKGSFNQLYGYTSDGDGIRHALMDEPNLDLEDARFFLVSCSAFINYLIVKADKAGIDFDAKK